VAWVLTNGDVNNPLSLEHIRTIEKWGGHNEPKVPSKITYSVTQSNTERWGYGVGGSAHILKETKLSLGKRSRPEALDVLRRTLEVLDSMSIRELNVLAEGLPRHVMKTPVEVVTDYLLHIAKAVRRAILSEPTHGLGQFPVDLIFTHPVEWDKQAMNLTFRAVTESFGRIFPELVETHGRIYMASEPEACAQYTMRDSQEGAIQSLMKGDCFIVVDAGGGTVDLAAYRVRDIDPFRVELATKPTGEFHSTHPNSEYCVCMRQLISKKAGDVGPHSSIKISWKSSFLAASLGKTLIRSGSQEGMEIMWEVPHTNPFAEGRKICLNNLSVSNIASRDCWIMEESRSQVGSIFHKASGLPMRANSLNTAFWV